MKVKTFLWGALSLLAATMSAQGWVAPEITSADYAEVKLSTSVVGDTTVYYLYNIDGKGFMVNGRADIHTGQTWNTHAVIGSKGNKVAVTAFEKDGEWDGQSVYIINYHSDAWKKLFALHERNSFVDYADQADAYPVWEMEKGDGNVYKFKVSKNNTAAFTDAMKALQDVSYMGFDIYDEDYVTNGYKPLTPMIDVLSDEKIPDACITWAFIPEVKYDAFQTAVSNYDAAKKLEAYIAFSKENYPAVNTAAAETVFNNIGATAAELDDARHQLQDDVYNYRIGAELVGASQSDPRDATSFMTNPDFETGNANGWTVDVGSTSASGYQGDSYSNGDVAISNFIQAWRPTYNVDTNKLGDGKISTVIKNMPAGKYKIACDAIAVFQKDGAPDVKGVYFFAKSGDEVNVRREIYTENQKPEHFEITFAISEQRDVEVGLRTESTTASWIAADNFKFTYYGEVTDPNQAILDGLVEQYESEFPDLDNVFANNDVEEAFTAELAKSKELTEGFEEQVTALKDAYQALRASIEEYKKLATAINDIHDYQEALEGSFPALALTLGDDLMEITEKYEDGTADSDYCNNISQEIYDKVAKYIAEHEKQGDEVTALIFNPNFNKGNVGWTWNPKNAADVKAMSSGNPVITAYGTTFDCSQTISGLKPGIYKLTVQGYYRTTGVDDAYSEYTAGNIGEICGETYLNNISAKLLNAFDDYYDGELSSGSNQIDGKWYPAGSGDIAKAFASRSDIYLNTVYGYVLDDGKLTLGVRQYNNPRSACYTTFDNFRLYYAGVDPEAVAMVTNKLQAEADKLDDVVMSKEARENMDIAVQGVKDAGEDNIMPCIGKFFDAVEAAKASAVLQGELQKAYEQLQAAIAEYEGVADASKIAAAQALATEIEEVLATGCKTDAECQDYINKAGKTVADFKLPDYTNATIENPVDFSNSVMVNPDFTEAGSTSDVPGWDIGSCNGYKEGTFSSFGAASHLYQTLTGLPEGHYIIRVQGSYRAGTVSQEWDRYSADPTTDRHAVAFGTTSNGTVQTPIKRICDDATDEQIHSKAEKIGNGKWVPGNTSSSVAYYQQGYYICEVEIDVPADGTLKLGVDKPTYVSQDYMSINYVHLLYCGSTANAISDVTVTKAAVKGIYNLAGQKLAVPQKGLNIINGEKVLVK